MAYVFSGLPTNTFAKSTTRKQRRCVSAAAERELWAPGGDVPAYLDGSLAGDFGYDPLRLASQPGTLKWMQHAELINGRFAMLGVAGILIPAIFTKIGIAKIPIWAEAGYELQKDGSIPFGSLVAVEAVLMGFVEIKRLQEYRKPGSQSEPGSFVLGLEKFFASSDDSIYPGGIFDPLGYSKGSDASLAELKLKEVKNARVAMLAFLGFAC
jgi:light-harvesting complex I chlorophyll a/b binding protein 5